LGHCDLVTWMGQTLIKTMLGQMGLGWLFFPVDKEIDETPTGPDRLWKPRRTEAYKNHVGPNLG
jgi:hypothetical protein